MIPNLKSKTPTSVASQVSNYVLPYVALFATLVLIAVLCSSCEGLTAFSDAKTALVTAGGAIGTASDVMDTATNIATLVEMPLADFEAGFQKLADATAPAADAPKSKVLTVLNKGAAAAAKGCSTAEKWIDRALDIAAKPAKVLHWLADKLGKK
jgi:hypothetical protein